MIIRNTKNNINNNIKQIKLLKIKILVNAITVNKIIIKQQWPQNSHWVSLLYRVQTPQTKECLERKINYVLIIHISANNCAITPFS